MRHSLFILWCIIQASEGPSGQYVECAYPCVHVHVFVYDATQASESFDDENGEGKKNAKKFSRHVIAHLPRGESFRLWYVGPQGTGHQKENTQFCASKDRTYILLTVLFSLYTRANIIILIVSAIDYLLPMFSLPRPVFFLLFHGTCSPFLRHLLSYHT